MSDQPPPYDAIAFDCDSTLSTIEGIEELARRTGRHVAELERLTERAMAGELALEAVYGRRLGLVRPSRGDVERVGRRYVECMVRNADRLIAGLRALGKRVLIVSGGVRPAVLVLARALGVPEADVHAVDLRFDEQGAYAGFDEGSPLARAGGKVDILADLRLGAGRLALVGDGATDLEAAQRVERFVAFGGVVCREAVFAAAAVGCREPDLAALVPLLLAEKEVRLLRADPRHLDLVRAAERFL